MKMRTEIPAESVSGLPQTSLSQTLPVNAFDAKQFLAEIEVLQSTCEGLGNHYEAGHYQRLHQMASKLFGIPVNGTDREVQKYIESEYNKSLKKIGR